MCKNQNKPQVTTTNKNETTAPPAFVQQAQQNLLGTGANILAPYLNAGQSGYGVAGFNQDQNAAFQGTRDFATNAMNGGGGINGADIQGFLNPYTQNVVDTTVGTLNNQQDRTLAGIRARAAASGAFGGSRGALQEAEANRNFGDTVANTTAQLMAAGYDKATATALASKQMDTSTRMQGLQGLLSSGSLQQQQRQTEMDVPLKALQNLLAITPQNYGSTTQGTSTTVGPPPDTPGVGQQVLGGLGSIAGLKMAGGGTIGGSLFSSIGSALPALMALSDRRDKKDIKKLGEDPETGLDIYAYRYKGESGPKTVGPMAQDVEKRFPGTTTEIGGHKVIDVMRLKGALGMG